MNFQRSRDVWTRHIVPRYVDDADIRVSEGGESVREEVEVIFAAARAFVDDLLFISIDVVGRDDWRSYHGCD